MRAKPILVAASFEKGRGSGHLARCGLLVHDLRKLGREAMLYLPAGLGRGRTLGEVYAILGQSLETPGDVPIIQDETELERDWAFIVFDRFSTPPDEFRRFAARFALIGIDEGGPERARFDFLLDLLPSLPSRAPPNELRPSLLRLPKSRSDGKTDWSGPLKILVSFGGEDAAKLGLAASRACAVPGQSEVELVGGALQDPPADGGSGAAFTFTPPVKNLRDKLARYDLVITHFGLCAFEALYARVPVLLLSPTRLHEALARNAGLVSAGRGVKSAAKLDRLLFTAGKAKLNTAFLKKLAGLCSAAARKYRLDADQNETLAARVNNFQPKTSAACPLCLSAKTVITARFTERTYRRCRRCGTLYMNRSAPPGVQYTEAYFFENYKKQYGKTYLEDFPNLTAMARRRLAIIKTLSAGRGSLLDIGCAYGAFAFAALGEGFDCAGIDGSAEAAAYVRGELRITAFEGFFPEDALLQKLREQVRRKFDVITLWYVIEHFEIGGDVKKAIETVNSLLNPGGILAFSTPNSRGISGRLSPQKFLKNSPADHWTIWNEHSAKKILPLFGFAIKKIAVTGHHPERFPFCSRLKPGGFMYSLVMALSRLFRLGDTFEVYAKKTRDCH
jgi:2-polyprenyl-3-methyl-5-hydroxy-6-metoxy-1,4-benzoquinol methylase/spore coat polysaccharide biosynthesis predicted glycosyltransferase SpsG